VVRIQLRTVVMTLSSVLLLMPLGCSICGKFFRGNADVVSLTISPLDASIQAGGTQQFSASGAYDNGTTGDVTSQTQWSSSDSAIATINSAGTATGIASGTVTVRADCQCYVVKTSLSVGNTAATMTSIAVTALNPAMNVGGTLQFTSTATYSNGTKRDVTGSVAWTSSNHTIATVTTGGLATGMSSGSATMTATSGSISGSASLTVQ
jgi:uncharacterized protein YjdB